MYDDYGRQDDDYDAYDSRRASGMSVTADTGRADAQAHARARAKEAQVEQEQEEDADGGQTVKLTDFDVVSTLGKCLGHVRGARRWC